MLQLLLVTFKVNSFVWTGLRLNRTVANGTRVWGLAVHGNKLYVGRYPQKEFEIYDTNAFNLDRHLSVIGDGGCINDMATCPNCDFVFAVDMFRRMIHVIDVNGARNQWNVPDWPEGISVNSQLNVIVTFSETKKLREFTPNGSLVREIILQSDTNYPWHAIQLDNNRYVVVHGRPKDPGFHRVCIVNVNGQIVHSYGRNRGSGDGQLNTPWRMALFGDSLVVSNYYNDRLLVFEASTLNLQNKIDLPHAYTMSLSADGTRLYTSIDEGGGSHIKVFDVKWV
jgi:hypothetical protein